MPLWRVHSHTSQCIPPRLCHGPFLQGAQFLLVKMKSDFKTLTSNLKKNSEHHSNQTKHICRQCRLSLGPSVWTAFETCRCWHQGTAGRAPRCLWPVHRGELAVCEHWLSTAQKAKQAIPLPTVTETKQSPYHDPSLFVQQVETCLILFSQDNRLTANSNRLFCLFIRSSFCLSS